LKKSGRDRKFFSQVFKMAANFKMAEKLVLDHNSVSFELFALFFVLGVYLDQAYFIEEKFFVRFKMASDV
jgi:hypothetical protein